MKQAILIVLAVLCLRTVTYGQAVTVTASAIKPNPNVAAPSGACPRRNAVLIDASTIYVCPESGAQNWTAVSGGGGGGVTIGTTTITGGTNTRVLYNNSGVFGSAPINVNALNSTYLDITSAASGSGLTLTVAGGGTNEPLTFTSKGTGNIVLSGSGSGGSVTIGTQFGSIIAGYTIAAGSTIQSGYELVLPNADNQLRWGTNVGFTRPSSGVIRQTNGSTGTSQLIIGTSTDTADAQLSVYSQSTTRPSLKLRALSGTSGSQNMDEVYDASGTLSYAVRADGKIVYVSGNTASTVGAAGGASALPATPTGYLQVVIGGTTYKIPYYAN